MGINFNCLFSPSEIPCLGEKIKSKPPIAKAIENNKELTHAALVENGK
jgi:hypothetical protein